MTFANALTWLRMPRSSTAHPIPTVPPAGPSFPLPPADRPRLPPSPQYLPVLGHRELIQRTGVAGMVLRIGSSLGLSLGSEQRDLEPLLQRLAEFVQLLPASESHHHAQPGGLLIHLLEVARYALHVREGYRLPLGASPEDQMRHGARCSYAVLVAALLHDIGKPLADLKVELVTGHEVRPWVPMAGSMNEQGGDWYRVDFPGPGERDYGAHSRLAIVLLHRLVPAASLSWLAQYPPVLQELAAYLSADGSTKDSGKDGTRDSSKDSALAKIVGDADRRSVAENLLAGPRTRFSTARAVPLIERLMEGLRRLLAEGGVPLNRAGATGYCDGESLWCVAKTLAEAVRHYLASNEAQQTGAAGIPTDNNRLFDTWQEYGALEPTPEGVAIWTIAVAIGAWKQTFTVLRFPLARLYADPARYPRALPAGAIHVIESAAESKPTAESAGIVDDGAITPPPESAQQVQAPIAQAPTTAIGQNAEAPDSAASTARGEQDRPDRRDRHEADDDSPRSQERDEVEADCIDEGEPAYLPDTESAAALGDEVAVGHGKPGDDAPVPDQVSAPVRPREKARVPSRSVAARAGARQPRPNAERFMAWVQEGVANGGLPYNESMARVHFVPEGMLLVTPAIFRDFAQAHPEAIEQAPADDGRTPEPWKQVQRDFQRSGYPVTAEGSGAGRSYLIHYNIKGAGGRQLSVMLVSDPERFFNPVPSPNAMIQSKQKAVVAEDAAPVQD
ncbi:MULTISPECIES: MobH family relaxase [Burkholderia cepacia complex]|uniref:MobH family relaxase n=1 Tax=Burkholderia cepacia complex TaxID=87882 RepID=UPI001CF29909|nr:MULTISPECIES: MobH family relaxase [Burkholderia cepacia complex]MCA8057151.1 TraI domain-containing protein [Burkholderia cepacia]MDN7534659.1 MobH family relaxase [Burkholderia orbicola]